MLCLPRWYHGIINNQQEVLTAMSSCAVEGNKVSSRDYTIRLNVLYWTEYIPRLQIGRVNYRERE